MEKFVVKNSETYILHWRKGDELQAFWVGCEYFTAGKFDRLDLLLLARALDFLPEGDILATFISGNLPIC